MNPKTRQIIYVSTLYKKSPKKYIAYKNLSIISYVLDADSKFINAHRTQNLNNETNYNTDVFS